MTDEPAGSASLSSLVAEEIRAMMARKRLSGRQLAQKLGVSPSWVSYRLTGAQPIDLDDLERIANALDVIVISLLPRQALQPQRPSSTEATTRYLPGTEGTTRAPAKRTPPAAPPRPKSRPKAATSPGQPTPKASTRRPAMIPRPVGA